MFPLRASTERCLLGSLLAIAMVLHAPLFLRSPIGPDPVMYDLQAQLVNGGGVLYRDILEPNLPGAVWIHVAVRSIGGWSTEALRLFDLAWFTLAVWLATRFLSEAPLARTCFAVILLTAYTTLSEWCHCQRDVWMLPPALGALLLRARRLSGSGDAPHCSTSILEGILWGAAVWLKPHVILPAAFVISVSWLTSRNLNRRKTRLKQESAVLLGGVVAGMAGVLWLVRHDAWSPLWTILTEWNRDYVAASANRWSWERLWSVQERLAPWSLIHIAALPISISVVISAFRTSRGGATDRDLRQPLASALYLGWIAQTLLLQHLFDYVHAPALLLGAIVMGARLVGHRNWDEAARCRAGCAGRPPRVASNFIFRAKPPRPPAASVALTLGETTTRTWTPTRCALAGILCLVPALLVRGSELALWPRCLSESSPALNAELARLPLPVWNHLARVAGFLEDQEVRDGALTAYHTHTIHLYPMLGVRPSTRFVFTETHLRLFPSRAAEIAAALANSPQKYVVSNLIEAGLDAPIALDDSDPDNWRRASPPDALQAFPFNHPVVFRSGPYLVHEVTGPPGRMETGFFPLAAESAGL